MTKTKLNIIKLNIITAILTLIFISCAPDNTVIPKPNNHTNPKENNQNFDNESSKSEDLEYSNQKYQDFKLELEKHQGNTASKLEIIKKYLEDEQREEDAQIAKIAQYDFLDNFKIYHYDNIRKDNRMKIKRIIYSSLNYKTQRIAILKEILEKLNNEPEYKEIIRNFLYIIAPGIQLILEDDLKSIKNKLSAPNEEEEEESEKLLRFTEHDLNTKQSFAKDLNKTIADYNNNADNIKTDVDKLANYMNEKYKDGNSLKPIY
ncbi:complement regulator-acquiring protein (plasmid) [Borreliella tanukii]|uniref:complement regulator-acquiring protein n=1 Tax=Borreliella tanukii TaxID=56146 RepID=UPI0026473FB6|nr:complement regulator-acquiring protein [Borreliella tanukii]WKC81258.1 complement regulator-acquiring protein [Borreliella tanukii]